MIDHTEPYDHHAGKELIGKFYVFDDGNRIDIIQVRRRDDGPWVTYHVTQSNGIPRKLLLSLTEFVEHYGHLFSPEGR